MSRANSESIHFMGNTSRGIGNQNFGNNYSLIGGTTQISHGNIIEGQLDEIKEILKILVDERQNQSATGKKHDLAIYSLERKMGQIAGVQNTRAQGSLPSDADPNPKPFNVVVTKGGKDFHRGGNICTTRPSNPRTFTQAVRGHGAQFLGNRLLFFNS
ncbi:hypothetical protein KY290_001408 [Solanum tuberosum]|uniref:Uncharacterized protein n=1 Tax=Solanum tuberosum TaxID=4113 RepID=A0ABQ7WM88_SOLTU|nr:hypothetical protein KY290_001408 [Solanum tuberosum]